MTLSASPSIPSVMPFTHPIEPTPPNSKQPLSITLSIEVCLKPTSAILYEQIQSHLVKLILHRYAYLTPNSILEVPDDPLVNKHVFVVKIGESKPPLSLVPVSESDFELYVYQWADEEEQGLEGQAGLGGEEQSNSSSHQLTLPSKTLEGLWESLIFSSEIQVSLLNVVTTGLLFGDAGIDQNLISLNRLVLLYGPPGTGKTSLCRALAQKLSIRLSHRYTFGKLIEINAHSLFSKFFSESGKLVQKMFDQIQSVIADEDVFVCVLIDEVESLTAARKSAMSGLEPSDALRVVNALLTQIDKLRFKKNVLVLATSNLIDAIDPAFIDRADVKQYIGEPSDQACYEILKSGLSELMTKGIIVSDQKWIDWRDLDLYPSSHSSQRLYSIAKKSQGLSGRTLRKLAFLAHARYIQRPKCDLDSFLSALEKVVQEESE